MRKKNLKPMIISALLAIGFGASTVGTSFALFTDKADTSISVTSGLVEVQSVAKLVRYHSTVNDASHVFEDDEVSYTNSTVGTTFGLSGHTISIDKMVPGDELTFSLRAINKSNVKTKTRYTLSHALLNAKADLFPALEIGYTIQGNTIGSGQIFKWRTNDPVAAADLATGVDLHTILVTVKFPNIDEGIIARDQGQNNAYQDAACSITFGLEAVQANANTDPIAEINEYLRAKQMLEGANPTMQDAVNDMNELGYTLTDFVGFGAYVWSVEADQFVAESQVAANQHKYFKVYDNMPATSAYSVYARDNAGSWTTSAVPVNGIGFDAGEVDGIASVSYTNSGSAKTNIIRTNSYDTSVTINAAGDVVKHYGDANSVNIIAVAGNSYHEYGRVAFTEIATGRIVLEAGSETKQIHLNAKDENSFAPIVIANNGVADAKLPEKITRDQIEVSSQAQKELVVVVEDLASDTEEQVYAYPYSYEVESVEIPAGTTEKTQTQNTNVETALGMKVIDSNNHDGEKALDPETKAEVKEEVIESTITEDALVKGGVVRIGAKYFDSFRAALNSIDKDGVTVRVIDKEANVPAGTNQYVLEHKDLTIHVEEGSTLVFPETTNENMSYGWGNAEGYVAFEGEGTVRFAKNAAQHPIISKGGSSGAYVTTKELTFIAEGGSGSYGYITDGSLRVNGGLYKDVSFLGKPVINDGMFSVDVSSFLPESKVCIPTSDPSYPYTVAALTAEYANFELDHAGEKSYFTTPRGVTEAAVSGDTVKFIGDISKPVIAAQGNNDDNYDRFMSANGVTYDLNGRTLQTRFALNSEVFDGVSCAFELGENSTITVKNGNINAYKLSSETTASIIAQNVSINDSCADAFDMITSGDYVKDSDTIFKIVNNYDGVAETDYSAKIERTGAGINEFYYTVDYATPVADAMVQLKSGDHAYVYAYEEDATAYLPVSAFTTTITKASGIDFPNVQGKDGGEVTAVTVGDVRTYTVAEGPFAYVGNTAYRTGDGKTFQNCLDDILDGQTLRLMSNIEIPENVSYDGYKLSKSTGTFTFDFNGYTLARNVDSSSHYGYATALIISSYKTGTITFTDTSENKNGGIHNKVGSVIKYNAPKDSTATLKFECGNYISDVAFPLLYNNNAKNVYTLEINGGFFKNAGASSFFGNSYNSGFISSNYNSNTLTCLTIKGGTFSIDPSSSNRIASGKTVQANSDGTYTVK